LVIRKIIRKYILTLLLCFDLIPPPPNVPLCCSYEEFSKLLEGIISFWCLQSFLTIEKLFPLLRYIKYNLYTVKYTLLKHTFLQV
jgi:hypothetical protein